LPKTGVREILAVLQNAIDKATSYIYIEDQTLNPTGPEWTFYIEHKALYPRISAACIRGVKVLFVTQGYSEPTSANLSMSPEIEHYFGLLQQPNFALYYVRGTKVHSKLVIIDDEFVSIGSANMWDRSMYGTESELSAAIVHPGDANSLAADLRVRLWRGHLRVQQSAIVDAELRDLGKDGRSGALGLFRAPWGTGVTFAHPDSALVEVPMPLPPPSPE
jgi:phosphatidylserine/phosphatidylglycerophosphate/cardiolipin synthase-like enzyme